MILNVSCPMIGLSDVLSLVIGLKKEPCSVLDPNENYSVFQPCGFKAD
jgi:hypothetical protein